jgi:hypothetical protein
LAKVKVRITFLSINQIMSLPQLGVTDLLKSVLK